MGRAAGIGYKKSIDLKVLVVSADGEEASLTAIRQVLDYIGAPYFVYVALSMPRGLTVDRLVDGDRALYQAVILATGDLGLDNGVSALSPMEWKTLRDYEAEYGARELNWYAYPDRESGFEPPVIEVTTDDEPFLAYFTPAGRRIFSGHVNTAVPLIVRGAFVYLAKPIDGTVVPLLIDSDGNALATVLTTVAGVERLALTFDSNEDLTHSVVLAPALIGWVTRGLFLGEQATYFSAQVDDVFIDTDLWRSQNSCEVMAKAPSYRINADDLQEIVKWQAAKQAQPVTDRFRLDLAFNGFGAKSPRDPLTSYAREVQSHFNWTNHTYSHFDMDEVSYESASKEITSNIQAASDLGLARFTRSSVITPELSGLHNPGFVRAARDAGVRYLVSDASRPGEDSPSPNAGVQNSVEPSILMVPRRPSDLYFNVSTPAEWLDEFNCIGRQATATRSYGQLIDRASDALVKGMLTGDVRPIMFHQANMRAYDGNRSLLADLLDRTFSKYRALVVLPVLSPRLHEIGALMEKRAAYDRANIKATVVPEVSITFLADREVEVPVTGLRSTNSTVYGGQYISRVKLAAGVPVTLPLE